MSKTHNHLSLEERAGTQVMLDHRCSLRAIARKLRRSASTISRELARSGGTAADASGAPGSGRPRTACGYRSPSCPAAGPQSPRSLQDGPRQRPVDSGDRRSARGALARAGQRHTPAYAQRCAHQPRDHLHRAVRHAQG